jgi:DNA excision repair protein ERCC-4
LAKKQQGKTHFAMPDMSRRPGEGLDGLYGQNDDISKGLKKKDKEKAERSQSRRRIMGGGPSTSSGSREAKTASADLGPDQVRARDDFLEL